MWFQEVNNDLSHILNIPEWRNKTIKAPRQNIPMYTATEMTPQIRILQMGLGKWTGKKKHKGKNVEMYMDWNHRKGSLADVNSNHYWAVGG